MALKEPVKNIFTIFESKNDLSLQAVITKAKYFARINTLVKQHLEGPLGDHCQVATYINGTLKLAVDSPVWASKVRFLIPKLIAELSNIEELSDLVSIQPFVLHD